MIAPGYSQERFSTIAGAITDASGASLPDVNISIVNKDTNRVTTAHSDGSGSYIVRQLEPGRYRISFERSGFNKFEVADALLLVGRELKVDATLQVGATQQSVQVNESAPLIDTTRVGVSNNITAQEFDRLPKARSFQSLALLSPSVNTGQIEGGFQINGASGSENQFVIDGISTNSLIDGRSRQNAAFEFLQEVQVKTGGIDAEYGGALGGVISAITKSGGNQFHGEGHYYLTSSFFSARPVKRLLLNPANENQSSYVQDYKPKNNNYEFGGSLGGYLIKNKVYFFTSYSPQFLRRENNYILSDGTQDSVKNDLTGQQLFTKVSADITTRLRANVSWLWTPTRSTGRLPAYDLFDNQVSLTRDALLPNKTIGYSSPQTSYTGQIDYTVTNTSILTIRGGRFWDNFKTTGVPGVAAVQYNNTAIGLPFEIPANLQQAQNFTFSPRVQNTRYDLTTRSYVQADYSIYTRFLGQHDIKVGSGISKTVNKVDVAYPGGGYVLINWNRPLVLQGGASDRGTYGYYQQDDIGTYGSVGAPMVNMYIQDHWRIHPRLTLTLGLRTENEKVPSFNRAARDVAFEFGFADKIAPRVGVSYDVFGNGKMKVYGSYGRFYDWVKYELSRGTFGGDYWRRTYRSLDTLDVQSLGNGNLPGRNIWPTAFRNLRTPSFDAVAPGLKPMSSELINAGVEYQLGSQLVFRGNYTRNNLIRTIEDLATVVNGDEVYYFANPGEGTATITPTGEGLATQPFQTPTPKRTYNALELSLTKRFSNRWLGSVSYVYSRLYGNYSGLSNSDEISTPTLGTSSATTQQQGGSIARPGSSASRNWDLYESMFDAHGNRDVRGPLATDRPHVVKFYGSYFTKWGTELGTFFYGGSGTPVTTQVWTTNHIPVFVNGRGDLGRTPFLTQTDLLVAHEVKFGEQKRLRFEFNAQNVFNQKTARHIFDSLNRGAGLERPSSAIDLNHVDITKGYNYQSLILASPEGQNALDPRYLKGDLFNPGFQGRLLVKFIF